MPREHPDASVHERWTEVIRDYEGTGELVTFRMALGDQDVSSKFDTGALSADVGALPWSFDSTLAQRIPVSLLNAPVSFYMEMAGASLRLFRGYGSYPKSGYAEWATSLSSLTPGHWMDKATLDDYVEFNGWLPENVIRNALWRVPYDKSRTIVHRWGTPLIYRIRQNADDDPSDITSSWASGFEDEDSPLSILDSVLGEVEGVCIDDPIGGVYAIPDPGIGEGEEIAWDYDAASSEVLEPFTADWADPDEQYVRVRVRDRTESGDYRIPPQDWYVNYSGMDYEPVVGRTYYVNLSDQTPIALERARKQAVKVAGTLGKGMWTGSMSVAFNYTLLPHDVITVHQTYEDSTGKYRRLWRCVLESVSHDIGTAALATNLSFRAALLLDRIIPDRPIALRGITPGNVVVPGFGFTFGVDEWGDVWIDPARMTGIPWAGIDADGDFFLDPALAPEGIVGIDTDGDLYLDIDPPYGLTYGLDADGDVFVDPSNVFSDWMGIDEDGDIWIDPSLAPSGTTGIDVDGDLYLEIP